MVSMEVPAAKHRLSENGKVANGRDCKHSDALSKQKKQQEQGSYGTVGAHSPAVTYASMLALLLACPPFLIILWYTIVHSDCSLYKFWELCKEEGFHTFVNIWPMPSLIAAKLIAVFAIFEALLQFSLCLAQFLLQATSQSTRTMESQHTLLLLLYTLPFRSMHFLFELYMHAAPFPPSVLYVVALLQARMVQSSDQMSIIE